MANNVVRIPLSGGAQGKGIKVVATATPGTTLHTTGANNTDIDLPWIYVTNSDTVARKLTIEWGGVGAPDDNIEVTVPAESGLMLAIPGLVLTGTGSVGNIIRAFSATANVLVVFGYVDRVTP